MTLLDAPQYNQKRAKIIRNSIWITIVVLIVMVVLIFVFWNWPEQHRVNHFFSLVQKGEMKQAYGYWNNDPDWQQHPNRYTGYTFADFQKDWGKASDYGVIKSHKIIITKTWGNGVVMGVDINGGKTPLFMRVSRDDKKIGFSPVELYVGP